MIAANMKRDYFPCLKCGCSIPYYTLSQHGMQCHEASLSTFTHPFIKDLILHAKIYFIKQDESKSVNVKPIGKKSKKKGKQKSKSSPKLYVDEPDFYIKCEDKVSIKAVLMNICDLDRCNLKAYSCVALHVDDAYESFFIIPDPQVKIGSIAVYEEDFNELFLSSTHDAIVKVVPITNVPIAEKAIFKTDSTLSKIEVVELERMIKMNLPDIFPSSIVYKNGSKYSYGNKKFNIIFNNFENLSCIDNEETQASFQTQNLSEVTKKLEELDISESTIGEKSSIYHSLYNSNHDQSTSDISIDQKSNYYSINTSEQLLEHSKETIFTSTPKRTHTGVTEEKCPFDLMPLKHDQSEDNVWFTISSTTDVVIECPISTENSPNLKQNMCSVYNETYKSMKKIFLLKLNWKSTDNQVLGNWAGILVHGSHGTGKTSLIKQLSQDLGLSLHIITVMDTMVDEEAENKISAKFTAAIKESPSTLLIKDLDLLCPIKESKEASSVITSILKNMELLKKSNKVVILVGTSSANNLINTKLRQARRFDKEVVMKLPDRHERYSFLRDYTKFISHTINEQELQNVADNAFGYSQSDLVASVNYANLHNFNKNCNLFEGELMNPRVSGIDHPPPLNSDSLLYGIKRISPALIHHKYLSSQVTWDDIYGYQTVKLKLKEMVNNYKDDPENNSLCGILLFGPPGCSKTMFVRALVYETGFTFFPVKCSNLLSKYVGETEKSLSKIFKRAETASPSLIFMDEVDSLCGDRSGSGRGLVSELLSLLSSMKNKDILFVGATNRPFALDEALLSPGCLDEVIHIPLPDCDSRCAIWEGLLRDKPKDETINLRQLCEVTAGYSGAEIKSVYQLSIENELMKLLPENMELEENYEELKIIANALTITSAMLVSSLKDINPRTPESLLKSIDEFLKNRKR